MAEKDVKAIVIEKESTETKSVEPKPYTKNDPIPAPNSSLARVQKGK